LEELHQLQEDIEKYLGVTIEDNALWEAIRLYNRTRSLLHHLSELRRRDDPPMTGAETLEAFLPSLVLPKEEYNSLLEELIEELEQRPSPALGKVRLMIIGSQLDDPEYYRLIEDQGAVVVIDDLCHGTKYFWDMVEGEGDPWRSLAQRYLQKPSCPHMHPMGTRLEHLLSLAHDFRVQGILYQTIKFCDPHAEVFPVVRDAFQGASIPVLNLEREYLPAGAGQWKTRIQAFLESLEM
jgi:benzoyl-CoA reductase/2-hydroxyglutaryl-CoA dehydratase subunit BcrC/BadD/HgdB